MNTCIQCEEGLPMLRHNDGLNIECADGHAQWVNEAQAEAFIWQP